MFSSEAVTLNGTATSKRLPLAAGKVLVKNQGKAGSREPAPHWFHAGGGAVALSMEEQRMLDEMERKLCAEDPRLASRFNSFGQQRQHSPFGSQRARTISGLLAFVLIAAVTVMMFLLSPYANHHQPAKPQPTTKTTGAATTADRTSG